MIIEKTKFSSFSFEKAGLGKPMIVFHGGPGLERSYLRAYLKDLNQYRCLYYFDQYGCGEDQHDKKLANFQITVDHAFSFIKSLNIKDKLSIFAHSAGCLVVLALLPHLKDQIEELIMITPTPTSLNTIMAIGSRRYSLLSNTDRLLIKQLRKSKHPEREVEIMRILSKIDIANWNTHLDFHFKNFNPLINYQFLKSIRTVEFDSFFDYLPLKKILIYGKHDLTKLSMINNYISAFDNVICFENSAHYPFIENPQYFMDIMCDFLSKNPTTKNLSKSI